MWWIALVIWREVSIALIACIHNFYTQTDQHLYHCFNITMAAISNDNHEATTNIDSTKVGVEMKQQLFHEKGDGMKGEKELITRTLSRQRIKSNLSRQRITRTFLDRGG